LKVECTEEGMCKRHLDVEVPADRVAEAFEQEVKKYSKGLKLPGFRKGKIPKDLVRNRFRAEILNQVVQELLPHALEQALHEKDLRPIGEPRLDNVDVDPDQPLRFRASFEVMPQIEVKDYKGLEVTEQKTEVGQDDIDKRLEALRERAARYDPVEDRGIRDGDFVMGSIVETPRDGGRPNRQEGAFIEVGTHAYHPTLDEKLQGVNPGDKVDFSVTFPPDYQDRDKANKTFDVSVEVKEVKEKVLPELDDELAKDLGEFDKIDELIARVREQAEEEARQADEQHLRNQLIEKLIEANPVEAPETLVEQEQDRRIQELAHSFTSRGLDPEGSGIDWRSVRERQRESAVQSVKASILVDGLIASEGIMETDEEVDREIERIASEFKKNLEVVRAQLMKEDGMDRLRHRLKRDKVFDLLRQSARIQGG
jgi:trigger factor